MSLPSEAGRIVQKYGLAVSDDGFDWRRSSDEVIQPSTIDANSFWYTELLFAEDTYFLFVEAGKSGEKEAYLATHQDPIRPVAIP